MDVRERKVAIEKARWFRMRAVRFFFAWGSVPCVLLNGFSPGVLAIKDALKGDYGEVRR